MDNREELSAIMRELAIRDIENYVSNDLFKLDLVRRLISNSGYEFDEAEKQVFQHCFDDVPKLRELVKLLPDGYKLQEDESWEHILDCLSNPENCADLESNGEYKGSLNLISIAELLDLAQEKRNYVEDKITSLRKGEKSTNRYQPGDYSMILNGYGQGIGYGVSDQEPGDDVESDLEPIERSLTDSRPIGEQIPGEETSDKPQKKRRVTKREVKPRFISGQSKRLNNGRRFFEGDDIAVKWY